MKRETRDEAITRANASSETATVLTIALGAVVNGELSARAKTRGGAMRYAARVGHLDRPHGGILILTAQVADQRADTTAHYVENWIADTRRVLQHMTLDDEALALAQLVDDVAVVVYRHRDKAAS